MNTTYTENAADIEAADDTNYQEILEELMEGRTLRQFAEQAGLFSHTLWGQMKAGERPINRMAKNRLREMVGLPMLPLLPVEVVAKVDPNARIHRTGVEPPDSIWLWNRRETPVNTVTAPCNTVTEKRRSHSKRYIRKWGELPVETLAKCIRERRDI